MRQLLILLFSSFILGSGLYGQYNTSYGDNAGNSGQRNTCFGSYAGDVVTGRENTFFGLWAGKVTTSGSYNTINGGYSGICLTTGSGNTYYGALSGRYGITSGYNTFLGYATGYNNTQSSNVLLGSMAKYSSSTGEKDVYIGYKSGYSATGSSNVFLGYNSGYSETGSNKLYIENSNSSSPLIYGEFDNDLISINGKVGIRTSNVPDSISLLVDSLIIAKEVVIKPDDFPDYVFDENHTLLSINALASYIKSSGHLPGIDSREQVLAGGMNGGDLSVQLLEKVEELTLYMIEMNQALDRAQEEQQLLRKELSGLQQSTKR